MLELGYAYEKRQEENNETKGCRSHILEGLKASMRNFVSEQGITYKSNNSGRLDRSVRGKYFSQEKYNKAEKVIILINKINYR